MNELKVIQGVISQIVDVPDDEWPKFNALWSLEKLEKGKSFIAQGIVAEKIGFILKGGMTNIILTPNGKELINEFFFEYEFIGSLESLVSKYPSPLSVIALEDCQLLVANYNQIETELYSTHIVWERLGRKLVEFGLIKRSEKEFQLMSNTAKEMYEVLIKRLGKNVERISKKYLASYLGIDPATLSRISK